MVQITKLEQAVKDWKSGISLEEAAKRNGVNKEQLGMAISMALNPYAEKEDFVGDEAAFQNIKKEIGNMNGAFAVLDNGNANEKTTLIVHQEEGKNTVTAFDSTGRQIDFDTVKTVYGIESATIDSDGRISFKGSKNFSYTQNGMRQESGETTFFDKLSNLFNRNRQLTQVTNTYAQVGNSDRNVDGTQDGVLKGVIGGQDVAKAAEIGNSSHKEATILGANGAVNAEQAFKAQALRYGVDAKAFGETFDAVKKSYAKLSDSEKAQVQKEVDEIVAAAKEGDVKTVEKKSQNIIEKLGIPTLGLVQMNDTVVNIMSAVAVIGAAYLAAETIATATLAKVLGATSAVFGLTSCVEQNMGFEVAITQDSSLKDALDALLTGQEVTNQLLGKILEREIQNGMTAEEILKLVGVNNDLLYKILDSMSENNSLLKEIRDTVKEGNEAVLETLITIKNSIGVLTELVAEYPDYSNEFNNILNAIKEGNASITDVKNLISKVLNQLVNNGDVQKDILAKLEEIQNSNESDGVKLAEMLKLLGEINVKIDDIAADLKTHFANDAKVNAYLKQILEEAKKNNETSKETNALLKDLYALVESLGKRGDELGKQILEYIAAVGFEMNRNFTALIAAVKEGKVDLTEITDLLKQLNDKVDTNGKKGEELGKQILNYIAAFGFETNQNFKKVIEAIGKDGAKLDSINALLAEINQNIEKNGEDAKKMGDQILNYIAAFGFETNQNFKKVLEAINANGAGSAEIKDMLQKVLNQLDKMDKNQQASAKAIIDAIANIKVSGGGAADLSTVEKMLAELLEVAKGNNKVLNSIDIKMDALNITTKSIEAKLDKEFGKNDERYKNVMNVLTAIKNKVGNGIDEAKLFEKLDNLANKLDDILAAIKDHKVTVDVTGKVTCECNCGNSHEGIIGDLEDILS